MPARTKKQALAYLRSVCLLANKALNELEKDHYSEAKDLLEYIQGDVEKLEACFGEGEIDG